MAFKLDLRVRHTATGQTRLVDGFCYVCGWCGQRFFGPHNLIKHVCEKRAEEGAA